MSVVVPPNGEPAEQPQLAAADPLVTADQKIEDLRGGIAKTLFITFPILLGVLLLTLTVMFFIILRGSGDGKALDTTDRMALAASVQVAFGMVMGFVSVFIGLMMTWFGISAAFKISGGVPAQGQIALKSASPGLLFFSGGIVLIGVALYKPIVFQEPAGIQKLRLPTGDEKPAPKNIPPLHKAE